MEHQQKGCLLHPENKRKARNMDQFLKFVSDVFECDMSEITLNTVYGELEKWDSMMMLRLTMELEEEYQVSIPIEAIGRIRILEDLYGYVKENRM